jgi:ubiquinone/menaquinone biosynthesis C-methylase UbiE
MTDQPSATDQFFELINAYQRTAALKAAVELGLFTAIADGMLDLDAICQRCETSPRGTRILCDYLAAIGLLTKHDDTYRLSTCAETYLDRGSPWYLGDAINFLASPMLMSNFADLAAVVRRGTIGSGANVLAPDHPLWVQYARAMRPVSVRAAEAISELVALEPDWPARILDIAAGHGMFGIVIAATRPQARIVAVDWPPVLAVAVENAHAAGLEARYRTIGGDALSVDFGSGYDVALVTNFLHHFDRPTCIRLLHTIHNALVEGGRIAILEFAPNDDRITPPSAAAFGMTMLAVTPAGEVHTASELRDMLTTARFLDITTHPFPAPQTIFIARK